MVRNITILIALLIALAAATSVGAGDWIFDSGDYTRSAKTGKRVDQYEKLPEVDRIPFDKFFSEDGPHPFGMDYWYGDYGGYGFDGGYPWMGYGMSPYGWGGYPYGIPYVDYLGPP